MGGQLEVDREDGKTIPIIALSADAIPDEIVIAKGRGLNAYFTKPIDPKELYQTLSQWRRRSI